MAGKCLYIVDDERDMTWVLARSLGRAGHTVVTATNGLTALQHMRRQTPDLAVLDITMPLMDGIRLAQRMRSDPWLAPVPILFATVHADLPHLAEAFGAGADSYVSKPFDLAELHARIDAILRRCGTRDPSCRDVLRAGGCTLDLTASTLRIEDRPIQLTPVECNIMRHLLLGNGMPTSAQCILEEVLDYPHGLGDLGLVRWHIHNLRQKIEPDPVHPRYLRTVEPRGYGFFPREAHVEFTHGQRALYTQVGHGALHLN
ncbi:MAG: response regulator transcription factor [Anaerolineae bacterium]